MAMKDKHPEWAQDRETTRAVQSKRILAREDFRNSFREQHQGRDECVCREEIMAVSCLLNLKVHLIFRSYIYFFPGPPAGIIE